MNYKTKLIPITKAVLILFFLGFVSYEVYKSTEESKIETKAKSIFSTDLLGATEIQIQVGSNQIQLVKSEKDWKIIKPIQEFADIDLITTWLQQIVNSSTEAVPLEFKTLDWEKYGLTDPLAKLKFKLADGGLINIEISSIKSFNEQFYLKYINKQSSQLLISDLSWLDFILKKPIDFISSKQILNFDIDTIVEAKIKGIGAFTKSEDLWTYVGEKEIDPARILGLLQDLKKLKIISLESNEATVGKKVVFNLEVTFEDKTNEVMQVFDHFKDCSIDTVVDRCQLMRVVSTNYPFWVLESKIKPIIIFRK